MTTPSRSAPAVGILANPMAGRDVRRLAARATRVTPESKRDQVARAVIGAVAAGAQRILIAKEPFRIGEGAVESLEIDARIELIDVGATLRASDTARAAAAMRDAGCRALLVLGGDGTQRIVAKAWPGAPLVPLSTGTNNVFPILAEATTAGAAAGLVASGRLELDQVARPAKCIRIDVEGAGRDLALVDALLLRGDSVGNFMPFDPARMRKLVLARALPGAVGTSPIGGLLCPARADDDFGVEVDLVTHEEGGKALRVPISPGLYRTAHVSGWRKLALGEQVELVGPGVLAFDGDRELALENGRCARLRVVREGPRVIDVDRALELAAELGLYLDRGPWRDAFDGSGSLTCC